MPDHKHPDRPTGQLIIPAQGFNVARLRGAGEADADEDAVYVWTGERWLSRPHAPNSTCIGDCAPTTGVCARDPRFRKGREFTYWTPLEFGADGSVQTFKAFQDSVTIEVA